MLRETSPDTPSQINLLDPTIFQWEIDRGSVWSATGRALAACFAIPCLILGGFLVFWAIGEATSHRITLGLSLVFMVILNVALGSLIYRKYWSDDSFYNSDPVVSKIISGYLFLILSIAMYLIAVLGVVDGNTHSGPEWVRYFCGILSNNTLDYLLASPSPIHPQHAFATLAVSVLRFLLSFTVFGTLSFAFASVFTAKHKLTGSNLDTWAYLFSPAFWLNNNLVRQTSVMVKEYGREKAIPTFIQVKQNEIKRVGGGYRYLIKQFFRHLLLPLKTVWHAYHEANRHEQPIHNFQGNWYTRLDATQVPFVDGMSEIIDFAARSFPEKRKEFVLVFSDTDFYGASVVLDLVDQDDNAFTYRWKVWGVQGGSSMTGRLYRDYFDSRFFADTPKRLFVQLKLLT